MKQKEKMEIYIYFSAARGCGVQLIPKLGQSKEKIMISYNCIGFDIRVWPRDIYFSCEMGYWDQNNSAIRKISEKSN